MKKWIKKHYYTIVGFPIILLSLVFLNFMDEYFNLKSNPMLRLTIYLITLVLEWLLMWFLFKFEKYLEDK